MNVKDLLGLLGNEAWADYDVIIASEGPKYNVITEVNISIMHKAVVLR